MSMTAHAVGVECWTEVSKTYFGNETSKMQQTLGNSVDIVRTKVMMKYCADANSKYAGGEYYPAFQFACIEIPIHSPVINTYSNAGDLYLGFNDEFHKFSNKANNNNPSSAYIRSMYTVPYWYTIDGTAQSDVYNGYFYFTGTYYDSTSPRAEYIHGGHYEFTYCIANTNSGGGGGAAGASVNYIIKAN